MITYNLSAQQNHRIPFTRIFLDIEYTDSVSIYDKPRGKCTQKLAHDFEEENCVLFEIIDTNDSMFYVLAYYAIEIYRPETYMGWIKKENYLKIYSRAYNKPLIMYESPNDKSKKILVLSEEDHPWYNAYTVLDCKDKWLKIEITYKNKTYQGWISPEMQCANVYSTCC